MRPVRFVALSEDGQALVLADEVGRLLALPLDERITNAVRADRVPGSPSVVAETPPSLAPRDIQARIRLGESAEDVARIAGVPVDRVLRYAGPVLQERAMLAQHARRTRLKSSDKGATLAEVADAKLTQHGVELEKVSWDAYRREDGTWRIVATWPSGKAQATAVWELDKARQLVAPYDDMANFLCGTPSAPEPRRGHEVGATPVPRPEPARGGHEPMYSPEPAWREPARPTRDPIRAGRDALLASLERPLTTSGSRGTRSLEPRVAAAAAMAGSAVAGSGMPGAGHGVGGAAVSAGHAVPSAAASAPASETPRRRSNPRSLYDDGEHTHEVPSVPSLAVLRPRRAAAAAESSTSDRPKPKRPSWDDVLFGTGPAAKDA